MPSLGSTWQEVFAGGPLRTDVKYMRIGTVRGVPLPVPTSLCLFASLQNHPRGNIVATFWQRVAPLMSPVRSLLCIAMQSEASEFDVVYLDTVPVNLLVFALFTLIVPVDVRSPVSVCSLVHVWNRIQWDAVPRLQPPALCGGSSSVSPSFTLILEHWGWLFCVDKLLM